MNEWFIGNQPLFRDSKIRIQNSINPLASVIKTSECSCASMHLHYSSKMILCRKYKKKCIIVRSETSNHPRICENFISEALTKITHVFNGLHIDNCPTVAYLRDLDIAF